MSSQNSQGSTGLFCQVYYGPNCGRPRLSLLRLAFQGPFEGLVKGSLGFFVLRLRNLALLALDLELKKLVLQAFEQHGTAARSRGGNSRGGSGNFIVFELFEDHFAILACSRNRGLVAGGSARGGLLARGNKESAEQQHGSKGSENPPAIALQGIGGVDGRAQPSAGTIGGLRASARARGAFPLSPAAFLASLQHAFSGNFKCQLLAEAGVGSHLHIGVGLVRVLHGLEAGGGRGVNCMVLGRMATKCCRG